MERVRETFSITDENRHLAGFTGADSEHLVIPPEVLAEGEFRHVDAIGKYAFADCRNLQTVVLLEGIKRIDEYSFFGCSELKSVFLPSGLTEIGEDAFLSCMQLSEVSLPADLERIGNASFWSCTDLKTISLPARFAEAGLRRSCFRRRSPTLEQTRLAIAGTSKALNYPPELRESASTHFEIAVPS